jgi:thiamine biosynthesis lipoprotein
VVDLQPAHQQRVDDASDWLDHTQQAMGGHLGVRVTLVRPINESERLTLSNALQEIGARVVAWAALLTRHHPSQLTRLNASSGTKVRVGPTMASLLSWSAEAWELTGGLVNIGMLDERLAAETGVPMRGQALSRGWRMELQHWKHQNHVHLCGGLLYRAEGLHFDLDGVGKGWIADRAAALLARLLDAKVASGEIPVWRSCFVDGDGDIAIKNRSGAETEVRIEIPRVPEATIGSIQVGGSSAGVATSGTGVHQWGGRHHIIDPHTGSPADSGIAQATVVAESARVAEAWAKSIVIGGAALIRRAEAAGVRRIVAVQTNGRIISAPALDRVDAGNTYMPYSTFTADATLRAQ